MLDELREAAFREAEELGHDWVGNVHFLLALLADWRDSDAGRALERSGVTYERVRERVASFPAEAADERRLNPRAERLLAFAEGFTAGAGAWETTAEHALFAILYDPRGAIPGLLLECETTRGEIVARMRTAGVDLPRVPLPPVEAAHA